MIPVSTASMCLLVSFKNAPYNMREFITTPSSLRSIPNIITGEYELDRIMSYNHRTKGFDNVVLKSELLNWVSFDTELVEIVSKLKWDETKDQIVKVTIAFRDSNFEDDLDDEGREYIQDQSRKHINEMMSQGYTSGELCESLDEVTCYGNWYAQVIR